MDKRNVKSLQREICLGLDSLCYEQQPVFSASRQTLHLQQRIEHSCSFRRKLFCCWRELGVRLLAWGGRDNVDSAFICLGSKSELPCHCYLGSRSSSFLDIPVARLMSRERDYCQAAFQVMASTRESSKKVLRVLRTLHPRFSL